jgi:hypothetical protein
MVMGQRSLGGSYGEQTLFPEGRVVCVEVMSFHGTHLLGTAGVCAQGRPSPFGGLAVAVPVRCTMSELFAGSAMHGDVVRVAFPLLEVLGPVDGEHSSCSVLWRLERRFRGMGSFVSNCF